MSVFKITKVYNIGNDFYSNNSPGPVLLEEFGWFGGICERKTLFRMKKEADQAGFKGTRTGPNSHNNPVSKQPMQVRLGF